MVENKEIAKGFTWTSVTQVISVLFKFLSLIILSRILSPAEYGLLAIIMIFIEIGNMICDSGMGGSLVKKTNCTHLDYDTLFIYNIAVCGIIYGILWVAAPHIANFYQKEIVCDLIRIASLQIIIRTLYIPQYIHVLKALNFKSVAIATATASSSGLLVAIIMAYNNCGVWALVGQAITEAIVYLIYFTFLTRYIPQIQFSKESFHEQFSFGINLLGANLLNTICNNIYNNVVAKVVDLKSAGYFVQATRIQNLPVSVTNNVIDVALFPILSKCSDKSEFENIYFRIYGIILMAICYLSAFMAVFSSKLVAFFLGSQWDKSAPILGILSISIVPYAINTICRNALKSQGKTFAILKNQIVKTTIMVIVLILASFFGFWYIVGGVVITHIIVALSILIMTCNLTSLRIGRHFCIIIPFIFWSITSTAIPYMILHYFPDLNAFISLVISLVISGTLYLGGLYFSRNSSLQSVINIIARKLHRA